MNARTTRILALPCATALVGFALLAQQRQLVPSSTALSSVAGPCQCGELQEQLASIQQGIDDLAAKQAALEEASGPFDVYIWDLEEQHSSQTIELIPGRVFVHSIHVTNNVALFFDGPGSATNTNGIKPTSGEMIAFGSAKADTDRLTINPGVIVENGLHMAIFDYSGQQSQDYVIIYYKALESVE